MSSIERFSLDRPGGPRFLTLSQTSTGNATNYYFIGDGNGTLGSATEANVDIAITRPWRITRLRGATNTNTKDGASVIGFRDDTTTVASFSSAAGEATTEYDSGALNVYVAAGSKVNWIRNTAASSSGTLVFFALLEFEVL